MSNTLVKLNQVGLLRRPYWVAANNISFNSIGRILSTNYSTQPRTLKIIFPEHGGAIQLFHPGDFEFITSGHIEKEVFCIVPFWYVPIDFIIRYHNTWWHKIGRDKVREIQAENTFAYPHEDELVITRKKELEGWRNRGPKCLMLDDFVQEEFEVKRNNPF